MLILTIGLFFLGIILNFLCIQWLARRLVRCEEAFNTMTQIIRDWKNELEAESIAKKIQDQFATPGKPKMDKRSILSMKAKERWAKKKASQKAEEAKSLKLLQAEHLTIEEMTS